MTDRSEDVITEEEWKIFQKKPYERNFDDVVTRFQSPVVSSEDDIYRIWRQGGGLPEGWSWNQYCPTRTDHLIEYLEDLAGQTDKKAGHRFCDLGMGTGFVQATFAALGFRTYGVDISARALEYAPGYYKRVQEELGREFDYVPVVARCDADTTGLASFEFPDGARMSDMDVVFFNIGDDTNYRVGIMRNFEGIKKGCVWMEYYIRFVRLDESWRPGLLETPFRPINPRFLYSFLVSR